MKNLQFIILLVSAFFCLDSCYSPRYVYSPSVQNVPSLHRKNDLEFSGFYAGSFYAFKEKGNYNRGFNIHTAWAITNHLAVMFNQSYQWEKNGGNDSFFPADSSHLSYKRNFSEVGVGYFSPIEYN
ncbi:MAG: hypothetical protein ACRDE5_10460, partial [Ginsengibacter sp.]